MEPGLAVETMRFGRIVGIASGKGGVGKSTIALNLAATWAERGYRVGIFDADVFGPSLPTLTGTEGNLEVRNGRIVPVSRFGMHLMSVGYLTTRENPLVWRGPMLQGAIRHLWTIIAWPTLDYLVVDLPPGSGEIHVYILETLQLSGIVAVTTPQDIAVSDVRRGVEMFRRAGIIVVGIVENMSYIRCPTCNCEFPAFAGEGGERIAAEFGVPLLAQLPLLPEVSIASDQGVPAILHPQLRAYRAVYEHLATVIEKQLASTRPATKM
jgi:ATP-binding protein involved in chromosome partitioning